MKFRVVMATLITLGHFGAIDAAAQCRPDFSSRDKITRAEVAKWHRNLTEAGFLKSLISEDIDVIASIGRYGDVNALNVEIVNKQNDRDRAAFDSRYRAVKGDRFFLGFGDAEPLAFEATDVNNQAQIENAKGLVMTVVLSARLTDSQLARMRSALTSKRIVAVRLGLSSGMVERSIGEGHGKAMMEKLSCFYQYLDGRGIKLSTDTESSSAAVGSAPGGGKVDLVIEDILAQEKLTLQAMVQKDMSYLSKHIADDAIFTSKEKQLTKRMVLAQVMEQGKFPGPIRSRYSNTTSKTVEDVVEVTTTTTLSVQIDGNWRDFLETRDTTHFRKVDGEWVILRSTNEYEKPLR